MTNKSKKSKTKKNRQVRKSKKANNIDMALVKEKLERTLHMSDESKSKIVKERESLKKSSLKVKSKSSKNEEGFLKTGVPGFDEIFEEGIPKGNSVLVSGGAGSGKTIFCLQTIAHHIEEGKKCFYMSFEESEERLIQHMEDFGWNPKDAIKKGNLKIIRMNPFEITRNVDAMIAKQKGELLIDINPVIIPKGFKPEIVVIDSLSAIASAFNVKDESYRIYLEQLFRFLEKVKSTNFLISETSLVPEVFSTSGVAEFLADGVIIFYNIKQGNNRERAIEVLKMRGEKHKEKIVAMLITSKGIVVYPDQEVFAEVSK